MSIDSSDIILKSVMDGVDCALDVQWGVDETIVRAIASKAAMKAVTVALDMSDQTHHVYTSTGTIFNAQQ